MALRFIRFGALCGALAMACLLTAAPAHATHPRPKSASPLQMSLVPAYAPCAAPNRTHGPPLAFPACNPPAQTSAQATVGTPDAFGGGANATGYLRLTVIGQVYDQDLVIEMALNDVRCMPNGARCGTANTSGPPDYSGEMRFSFAAVRLTDHGNATTPAGGTDAGAVPYLRAERQLFELDAARIFDGGADGDGDTAADNTVFVRPGVFIP